jgi:phosphohistidine phosphatase
VILYLQRHCQAAAGAKNDPARGLTDEGKLQAEDMAAFLVRQVGRVDIVISSPFARALETAKVMGEALGAHVVTTKELQPDSKPVEAWAEIKRLAQASKEVLVVGHHPDVGHLIDHLAGVAGISHAFEHGSIAAVDPDQPAMRWLVDHQMVKRDMYVGAEEADVLNEILELADAGLQLAEALQVDDESDVYLVEGWVTINGSHVFINDLGIVTKGPSHFIGLSHKAAIARSSYSGGDKRQQDIAEKMENHLASALGMKKSPDNKPFDLFGTKYAVEVKTLVSNTNGKITMNAAAIARKDAFIKESGLKPFTVVVDARGVKPTYFVRAGYGSFRLGSMTAAASPSVIRSIMKGGA